MDHIGYKELRIIKEGLKEMFEGIDIDVTIRVIKTSERSSSLYIYFNDLPAKPVRISNHPPSGKQKDIFINIF